VTRTFYRASTDAEPGGDRHDLERGGIGMILKLFSIRKGSSAFPSFGVERFLYDAVFYELRFSAILLNRWWVMFSTP
jgi:hypothetical protein